jgi:nucleotide-binding universal stress UspA family protein
MLAIKTILHPTDFSDGSALAFRLACSLARDYGARLIVLHAAPPPALVYGDAIVAPVPVSDLESLHAKLRELRPRHANVAVEHRLIEADPASTILQVTEDAKADVIVMGTHGRTGLSRVLMGSVAEQVVRKAPCPVVTVKALPSHVTLSGRPGGGRGLAEQVEDLFVRALAEVLVELADGPERFRAEQADHVVTPAADLLEAVRGSDGYGDDHLARVLRLGRL